MAIAPAMDCKSIASDRERLNCFDAAAGTPARVPLVAARPAITQPDIVGLVEANESARDAEDHKFLMSVQSAPGGGSPRMVISAPALGAPFPRPVLAISCQSGITRLQLLLAEPIEPNQISLRLFKDENPLGAPRDWRVLDTGRVIDAGRGLPAIELLRGINGARRLRLASTDYPPLDGLVFDAEGLDALIKEERSLCRW